MEESQSPKTFEGTENFEDFYEYFSQLSEEDQKRYLRIRVDWSNKHAVANDAFVDDNVWIENGNKVKNSINKEYDYIHKDNVTGRYHHTKRIKDYIEDCHEKLLAGGILNESEIIFKNKNQSFFLTTDMPLSSNEIKDVADTIKNILSDIFGKDVKYVKLENPEKEIIELRFWNITVKDHSEKLDVLEKIFDYKCSNRRLISQMFKHHLNEHESDYEEALGLMSHFNKVSGIEKLKKYNQIQKRQNIIVGAEEDFKKYVVTFAEESYDRKYGRNLVAFVNVDNSITINGDVIIGQNDHRNIIEFYKHIKKNEPEWYKVGQYIPKKLFADMFNEFDGDKKSVRLVMSMLKGSGLKSEIVEDEKICKVDISKYGFAKKSYNCMKLKKL